ncbi:hypothetical protein BGZ76_007197 [Entomortierella beljakovae]|nr:hypothetical protein BGZ76_007197 [Entomortierella beljakovae]
MVNDRSASAQMKKNNRAEEWLKNAVKDKHVRLIPFSEISKVKYNVAKGGSGTIHLGAWRNMHVAIKEQHNTNDLIKELKMHKQVHDSNYIVKFFGITKHPLTHDTCIVMQFAENGCLQDYLENQNVSITWLSKYRLAWEIASGLDFIHRENIFHTDLHSRNILIDTDGKALITDFGLSKSVNKTIYTTKAGLFGVVPYVAPERMQNPTITYNAKCDIYSLGVILWELSSCVIPFEAQLQDVMLAVNIIAGVREKTVPGTAVEYEMLYRRCWDGLPQNRPQMEIVLSELVELLASEQINPRSAALRPRSPRPARPLSSDSMIAPSTVTYETDVNLQSSPENSTYVRPASPPSIILRPGVRQSFGQGMVPLVPPQPVPSVPIRQDRSGVRVSFLGEPLKEPIVNGNNKANGVEPKQNGGLKPMPPIKNPRGATNGQPGNLTPDGPAIAEATPKQQGENGVTGSTTDSRHRQEPATSEPPEYEAPAQTDASLQLLPPLPSFNALSLSKDALPLPSPSPPPPPPPPQQEPPMNKLNTLKNISTISPPPHGALPQPPGAVAGHSNTPRVISPPTNSRPQIVSPPKTRNNIPRASKTISPPSGPPPLRIAPSPSLGPIPKPPSGPPPSSTSSSRSATPIENGAGVGSPKDQSTASDTTRPTPARQIPMGFPVVTPLSPPHWKKPAPLAESNSPVSPPPLSPSSAGSSPSGSPSSSNSTGPSSTSTSPSSNRRDFRPVSFLTSHKNPESHDNNMKVELNHQLNANAKKSMDNNTYFPNPNNNIVPPSQFNMHRAQSPEMSRATDIKEGLILGSPSLRPAPAPAPSTNVNEANNKIINSPHLAPTNNRPDSPAFVIPSSHNGRMVGAGFPIIDGTIWAREPKNDQSDTRSNTDRPHLPTKESSSSATTTNTSFSTSPSNPPGSAVSSSAGPSPTLGAKHRVPQNNFYSLSDPYKELTRGEPSDFFTAVTHSDINTMERLLKVFPGLINESNGFWPHPTAILVAARSRNAIDTMKFLIQRGAALDRGDHNGITVLHFVCEQYPSPTEAVQFLAQAGADCNSRDAKKRTPLMALMQNTRVTSTKAMIDSMKLLLKFGAQTKVMDNLQKTPLHYAIVYSKDPAPVMELLLKKGADVNARESRKATPLHMVLEKMDNEEIVQMLLLYGADPGLKNGTKRNALGVAAENLRVMSAWFLLENDLLSSAPDSIKKANELCSKAEGPDKSAKPLFKNTLSDWHGKDGKLRRIQLAQDCVLRVQRTPDMKTIDQTQVALEFLESVGQPIHANNFGVNSSLSNTPSQNAFHPR